MAELSVLYLACDDAPLLLATRCAVPAVRMSSAAAPGLIHSGRRKSVCNPGTPSANDNRANGTGLPHKNGMHSSLDSDFQLYGSRRGTPNRRQRLCRAAHILNCAGTGSPIKRNSPTRAACSKPTAQGSIWSKASSCRRGAHAPAQDRLQSFVPGIRTSLPRPKARNGREQCREP